MKHNGDLNRWLKQFDEGEVVKALTELCDLTAFLIIDSDQRIVEWSRGAEKLSGYQRNQMLGEPCLDAFKINESEQVNQARVKLLRTDGKRIEIDLYRQAIFDRNGNFAGGVELMLPASEKSSNAPLPKVSSAEEQQGFHGILSRTPEMKAVFQIIQNAARTEATVLVRGESGSGKELVARAIHDLSSRRDAPFLAINCAALSINLLESELFGHVRGAFSGAIKDHTGLFQRANGGTLFLDEVAELPLELQAKLLRVLQERNYIPVGGDRTIDVDVRIVAATHRSLREEVKSGRFREDLMYRLRVIPIFIPPLRERREDISLLLWHFIKKHNIEGYRHIEKIDPEAMKVLLDYPWPGNIRELQNVLEYAFAVGRGTVMRLSELPPEFREPVTRVHADATETVMSAEEEMAAIRQALEQSNGKITHASRLLGMSRATFWRKRKHYRI